MKLGQSKGLKISGAMLTLATSFFPALPGCDSGKSTPAPQPLTAVDKMRTEGILLGSAGGNNVYLSEVGGVKLLVADGVEAVAVCDYISPSKAGSDAHTFSSVKEGSPGGNVLYRLEIDGSKYVLADGVECVAIKPLSASAGITAESSK